MNELTLEAWIELGEKSFSAGWIAALWIIVYVASRLAELLNVQSASQPLPEELSKIQPPEEHQKAFDYLSDRTRLTWFRESLLLVGFLVLLYAGGFTRIHEWAFSATTQPVLRGMLFATILSFLQACVNTPFSYYSTFVIEERYGFNRTTLKTFVLDLVKGTLIGAIIGGLLYWFAVSLFTNLGDWAWLWIWIGYTVFQLFLTWIAPVALLPLFLKLTPLPEGELKAAIEKYSQEQNFKLDGVWVCDASKRSAKSNAFFTGFGKYRRLVLFDTLIEKHPVKEIVSVVAHEAGHFKLGHIWKGSIFSAVTTLVILYAVQRMISSPELYLAFGVFPPTPAIGLIFAFMVLGKFLFFFSFLSSYFSRKNEYSADRFSIETAKDPESMIGALKRLTTDNLAILNPHPLHTALFASHPPLVQRMAAIRAVKTNP